MTEKTIHDLMDERLKSKEAAMDNLQSYYSGMITGHKEVIKDLKKALGGLIHHCEEHNRSEESFMLAMEIEKASEVYNKYKNTANEGT